MGAAGGQMNALDNEKDVLKRVPISKHPFGIAIADLKRAATNPQAHSLVSPYREWHFLRKGVVVFSVFGSALASYIIAGSTTYSFWEGIMPWTGLGTSVCLNPGWLRLRGFGPLFWDSGGVVRGNVFTLFVRITIGYLLYMLFNVYGHDYKRFTNHFLPQSGIFNDSERGNYVVLSDIGIITVLYALYHLAVTQGGKSTLFLYVIPLFMEGGFFIMSTYLSHTHPSVAHYDSTEWDWLRGALSTIDRDFGILNWIQQDINSSHVIHHLFPNMPHYHAVEATKAVRPI
ncbi:Fatty acid desaturase, type 1 [Artemisia annua]|uniref:Fatty acid desaturase, type 1 n=1 Tax=Artemisia annua TaxID=35608 RepID=A0A2U1LM60_ARTAN|nr:Fatty acid desaturase, type 1 [Artemisia annua]